MRRKESYFVLKEVLVNNKHAHLALKELDLKDQDQAFVSALVYTVLQNLLFLEYQFDDLIKPNTDMSLKIIFYMAAAQAFKMRDIPDYAIVNESVELAKEVGEKYRSGFVNAVLKKMMQRGLRDIDKVGVEKLSIETSMPLWILKLLQSQYSFEFAHDYAHYVQSIKPTYAWINKLVDYDVDMAHFEQGEYLIAKSSLFKDESLAKGAVVIQDKNSQAVVDGMPLKEGMNVLDCCCAPGTKTLRIANKMNDTGTLIGVDLVPVRVEVTKELMKRAGVMSATILEGDAAEISFDTEFDVALIDAPCSGLGVLAHKHDLRYNIQPSDLDALQKVQRDILSNISKFIKVEGTLVYATCTLNKKENEKQIEAFLNIHTNYELVFEKTYNPMETQGDGFYVAHCIRKW